MITNNFSDCLMDNRKPAIFLDRDAIMDMEESFSGKDPVRLDADTIASLEILSRHYDLFGLVHESGIPDDRSPSRHIGGVNLSADNPLRTKSIQIKTGFVCSHRDKKSCDCLSPNSIFLREAASRYDIDLSQSFMIGNHPDTVRCGESLGVFGLYLLSGEGARHLTNLPSDRLVFHSLSDAAHWIGKHPKPALQLEDSVRRAAAVVKKGGLVAFPTETVYGLGADTFNTKAIAKIFESKGRPLYNPLIVHIADIEQLASLAADIPDAAWPLINRFWPGPLTLIFNKKHTVPDIVTAGLSTVAVRMPANPLAAGLIRLSETPIAAPSANLFGRTSATSAAHVMTQLQNLCDAVIDGGACRIGLESTVLSLTDDIPRLLRPGAVSPSDIKRLAGPIAISSALNDQEKPRESPGMLSSHYATKTPLYLVDRFDGFSNRPDIGALLFSPAKQALKGPVEILSLSGDLNEAAANLYAAMRRLDAIGLAAIIAIPPEESGIGIAINDRLRKAACKGGFQSTNSANSSAGRRFS